MSGATVQIAVVGHTNTGKTSLMRTLTRDVDFGEVSNRPAVTRHVEGRTLTVGGRPVAELYDTPGLEDSIGLLDLLDELGGRRADAGTIDRFLASDAAVLRFEQEAKAIRQVVASDVALYVIDVRDRVLGKHHDELEILRRCATPVVPVLNFTASEGARTDAWREALSRAGMHAIAEFDTVVVDDDGERRLFEKIRSLVDAHRDLFTALIEERTREREGLVRSAARLVADLLLDAAAFQASVSADRAQATEAIETARRAVREREQQCLTQLLELFRFRPGDVVSDDLPVEDGQWGLDLFSPDAMRQFSVRAAGGAAAGAAAGLAVDALVGGVTLGAAAATGAAAGAAFETARLHGRRLLGRLTGKTVWRLDDVTLLLLAARQIAVIRALLRRGHAGVRPDHVDGASLLERVRNAGGSRLPRALTRARTHPEWSGVTPDGERRWTNDPDRLDAERDLTDRIGRAIRQPADQSLRL